MSGHCMVQCLDCAGTRLHFVPDTITITKYSEEDGSKVYIIVSTMRSTPSLFKKSFLISGSARAEHSESNTFSINSVSSASVGSRRRNCWQGCEIREQFKDHSIPMQYSRVTPLRPSRLIPGD